MPTTCRFPRRGRPARQLISMLALVALAFPALASLPRAAHAQAGAPRALTLGDAARLAAERGAPAVAGRERAAQSEARARQQRADLLPSLTAGAQLDSRTFNTASFGLDFPAPSGQPSFFDPNGEVTGPVRTVDLRVRATQRLVDLPAVIRWRAAGSEASAAQWDAAAAADAAARAGALAYVRVQRADALLAARAADSSLAAELLAIARQQLAAGTAIGLDVTRAEAQLASTEAQLIVARSERDRAKLDLLGVLSLPLDTPLELRDSLALPSPADSTELADDVTHHALARRPDLRAAEAETDAARQQVRAARAERLPSVALFADHGSMGKDTDHLLGTYSYGVQVSLPLVDGFRRGARADEQRAREREADARWKDARLRAEIDVRSALVELDAARQRVAAAGVRLRLGEQELAQARERFRAGVAGNADVVTASLALNDARDLVVDAVSAYHAARVALAGAQGTATTLP